MKACCQVRIIYYYYYVSRRRVKTIHHTQLRRRGGTRSQITVYIVRILTYVHICKRNQISVDTYRINVCTIYAARNAMCVNTTVHVTNCSSLIADTSMKAELELIVVPLLMVRLQYVSKLELTVVPLLLV